MNKFKFGDKVLCNWEGRAFEAVILIQNEEGNWVEVIDDDGYKMDIWIECVELIPHPDTVRLDWLEQQMLGSTMSKIVYDGYCFGTVGSLNSEIFDTNLKSLREAIDFAISEENADE